MQQQSKIKVKFHQSCGKSSCNFAVKKKSTFPETDYFVLGEISEETWKATSNLGIDIQELSFQVNFYKWWKSYFTKNYSRPTLKRSEQIQSILNIHVPSNDIKYKIIVWKQHSYQIKTTDIKFWKLGHLAGYLNNVKRFGNLPSLLWRAFWMSP